MRRLAPLRPALAGRSGRFNPQPLCAPVRAGGSPQNRRSDSPRRRLQLRTGSSHGAHGAGDGVKAPDAFVAGSIQRAHRVPRLVTPLPSPALKTARAGCAATGWSSFSSNQTSQPMPNKGLSFAERCAQMHDVAEQLKSSAEISPKRRSAWPPHRSASQSATATTERRAARPASITNLITLPYGN
jgi:hypothetical protein